MILVVGYLFKHQSHKMVKHTQTICRQKLTNCLSVFDHFVGLVFEGLLLVNPVRSSKTYIGVMSSYKNYVGLWDFILVLCLY